MGSKGKVLIVGAGITGMVAGRLLERKGYDVTYFDDERPLSGTGASAGLISPKWLAKWETEQAAKGLDLLDRLYGLKKVPLGKVTANQVSPQVARAVMEGEVKKVRVTKVGAGWVRTEDSQTYTGNVLVAVGAWVNDLLPKEVFPQKVTALQGAAFLWDGNIDHGIHSWWSPYRQTIVFERNPGEVWGADGSALKPENWTKERLTAARQRVKEAWGARKNPHTTLVGWRPIAQGHPEGLFQQVMGRTWVATGAGKGGTLVAALQAIQFLNAIRNN